MSSLPSGTATLNVCAPAAAALGQLCSAKNDMSNKSMTVVASRMTKDEKRAISTAAAADGRTLSSFIRRTVLRAIRPSRAATAAPTDSGSFCCQTSGKSDQTRVHTHTAA